VWRPTVENLQALGNLPAGAGLAFSKLNGGRYQNHGAVHSQPWVCVSLHTRAMAVPTVIPAKAGIHLSGHAMVCFYSNRNSKFGFFEDLKMI
jgi:hypothetical protein